MTEIKSEKAKELIRKRILDKRFNDGLDHACIRAETAILAVAIAEQEAEERNAKELRDKAIEAHRQCCKYKEDWFCSDLDNRTESGECDSNCQYIKLFSQKLTE